MKKKIPKPTQKNLFTLPAENTHHSKFIATYRVTLIKDRQLPFESCRLSNSAQAQPLIKSLIETHGQPDREQFCAHLDSKLYGGIGAESHRCGQQN